MNKPLKNRLECLQAEGRTVNVFFRDDDVDRDEDTLRQLLDMFLLRRAPVNLEVIPGRLTGAGVALLRQYPSSLFELNQHGWQHVNYEQEGRKCEFGVSRGFQQQLEDIANGQQRMSEAFGDKWSRVFTPPWNRCTEETFRALDRLGFDAISKDRGKLPIMGYQFREISITFDLYRWKGEPAMKSPESIFTELAQQMNELDTVGILLHHKVMDAAAFAFLAELIETLSSCSSVRFHTFQSLLRANREMRAAAF